MVFSSFSMKSAASADRKVSIYSSVRNYPANFIIHHTKCCQSGLTQFYDAITNIIQVLTKFGYFMPNECGVGVAVLCRNKSNLAYSTNGTVFRCKSFSRGICFHSTNLQWQFACQAFLCIIKEWLLVLFCSSTHSHLLADVVRNVYVYAFYSNAQLNIIDPIYILLLIYCLFQENSHAVW